MSSNKIKENDRISYKELTSFLHKEFPGTGFSNKRMEDIKSFPKNKSLVKDKLLKLSKLKIASPVEIHQDEDETHICFVDLKNRKYYEFMLFPSYVYVYLISKDKF